MGTNMESQDLEWVRSGDRSHPNLVQLDSISVSYPGWQMDFQKAEYAHLKACNLSFEISVFALEEKHRVHNGNRSHPRLVELDSLELSYPGWEEDIRDAEDYHLNNCGPSMDNGIRIIIFRKKLTGCRNKQATFLGVRSHPNLHQLDALCPSYPGWQIDFQKAEDTHLKACNLSFGLCLFALEEKQRVHKGDRSHPRLVELDSTELSYPGWEEDIRDAEDYHLNNCGPSMDNGIRIDIFRKKLTGCRNKQAIFEIDRSTNYPTVEKFVLDSCAVCLTKTRTHVFVPCGHLCACQQCASDCLYRGARCPICRQPAEQVIRVYFS
jgi:hypothetical protein